MINAVIIAVVIIVVGLATAYVIKAKKSGHKCIGCPNGGCGCQSASTKPGQCCGNCGSCGRE